MILEDGWGISKYESGISKDGWDDRDGYGIGKEGCNV